MRRRTKRINLVLLSESVKHNRQKNKTKKTNQPIFIFVLSSALPPTVIMKNR